MQEGVLQVSEAQILINQMFEMAYPVMLVEGEVSGFTVNRSNYVFFDLKDEEASLGCFMMAYQLKFPLEDGMKIRVVAQPKLTNKGKFSLTIREMQPVGEGSLKKAFDILKSKLEKEGLFDVSRKRTLPYFPGRIGVISSSQAAGFADFTKILDSRWSGVKVELANVSVQGLGAPGEIVRAVQYFNERAQPVDVLVVIRGGGSADDLAAFNHEDVVRAIAASRIPTIVGVGHEVDMTLSDLVADVRASTPSNAAQLVVPDRQEFLKSLRHRVEQMHYRLEVRISEYRKQLDSNQLALQQAKDSLLNDYTDQLILRQKIIEQLDPTRALKRGYALVRANGALLKRASDVTMGDKLTITLGDGSIEAEVTGHGG